MPVEPTFLTGFGWFTSETPFVPKLSAITSESEQAGGVSFFGPAPSSFYVLDRCRDST